MSQLNWIITKCISLAASIFNSTINLLNDVFDYCRIIFWILFEKLPTMERN